MGSSEERTANYVLENISAKLISVYRRSANRWCLWLAHSAPVVLIESHTILIVLLQSMRCTIRFESPSTCGCRRPRCCFSRFFFILRRSIRSCANSVPHAARVGQRAQRCTDDLIILPDLSTLVLAVQSFVNFRIGRYRVQSVQRYVRVYECESEHFSFLYARQPSASAMRMRAYRNQTRNQHQTNTIK